MNLVGRAGKEQAATENMELRRTCCAQCGIHKEFDRNSEQTGRKQKSGRCREGGRVDMNMRIFPGPGKRKVENPDDSNYGTDVTTGAVSYMKSRHSIKITQRHQVTGSGGHT